MVLLRPFTGYVVAPGDASRVVAPPYDALTPAQREALAASATESYLNVLPTGRTDGAAIEDELRRCRRHLDRLVAGGRFRHLDRPALAVYGLTEGGHRQVGVVGDVAVTAFSNGQILPHERVRGDRVARLTRYLEVVGINSSPVCVAHPPDAEVDRLVATVTRDPPTVAFQDDDGTIQELWLVAAADLQQALADALARTGRMLLVDGHHRAAAAAAHATARGAGVDDPAAAVLTVAFPTDHLRVLPFHRLVRVDVDGPQLTGRLARNGVALQPLDGPHAPDRAGCYALTTEGRWFAADLRDRLDPDDPVASLDVQVAARELIGPLLAGADPFTDPRVEPVAAPLGLAALEQPGAVGVALPAPTVEQVRAVAEAGAAMPPKTTYFTPKVRSGLLVRPRSGRDAL